MSKTPAQRLASVAAALEARMSNLSIATRQAADAMAEFGFVLAVAEGTDEAVRAGEIADAAVARSQAAT